MDSQDFDNDLLNAWLNRGDDKKEAFPHHDKNNPIPLSMGQQKIWFLQNLNPESTFYNYAESWAFDRNLDIRILKKSFESLCEFQPSLRTNFYQIEGVPYQKISSEVNFVWKEYNDVSEAFFKKLKSVESHIQFSLEKDALVRVSVVKTIEGNLHIILCLHHLIVDEWSMDQLRKQWVVLYQDELHQSEVFEKEFPSLKNEDASKIYHYSDFSAWDRNKKVSEESESFWLNQLVKLPSALNLPFDFERPEQMSYQGGDVRRLIPEKTALDLKEIGIKNEVTPFVLFLSIFKIVLRRYNPKGDIIVGTPFSNRIDKVLEPLIGFFNDTLVLRSQVRPEFTFSEILKEVKNQTYNAFEHQDIAFENLVNLINPERKPNQNPLFQTMFILNDKKNKHMFGEGISFTTEIIRNGSAKFDLTLFVEESSEGKVLNFEYNKALFSNETIELIIDDYFKIIKTVTENKELLDDYHFINFQLKESSKSKVTEMKFQSILSQIFNTNIDLDRDAVVADNGQINYRTLFAKSLQIAKFLKHCGLTPGEIVAIDAEKSWETVTAILGTLLAGGGYLPIDQEYPEDRINYMLEDSNCKYYFLNTNSQHLSQRNNQINYFNLKECVERFNIEIDDSLSAIDKCLNNIQPDQLAYVIYTSGSTGKPKAVRISHSNLLHSNNARLRYYEDKIKAFLLLSSFSFDSSVAGLFWSLSVHAKLVIGAKRIEQNIEGLSQLIAKESISHTLLLPTLYQLILEYANPSFLKSLNTVIVAGEACLPSLVKRHYEVLERTTLYNEYGPTEATVWCTVQKLVNTSDFDIAPIGRSIQNVTIHLLDENYAPVKADEPGEIFIEGPTVSEGYLNDEQKSFEKFVTIVDFHGQVHRLYKTGDLGKFNDKGELLFLGRVDRQVKVRGHRIELDEISNQILLNDEVVSAATIYQNKKIISVFTSSNEVSIFKIKEGLRKALPDYMVPSSILHVKELPLLPNGKIDINEILSYKFEEYNETEQNDPPLEGLETLIALVWREVLGIKYINRTDNYFEIGGDSISSIQIVSRLRLKDVNVNPNDIFDFQTIASLSNHILHKSNEIERIPLAESLPFEDTFHSELGISIENFEYAFPITYSQNTLLFHSINEMEDEGAVQIQLHINGKLDIVKFERSWNELILKYEALRSGISYQGQATPKQVVSKTAEVTIEIFDEKTSIDDILKVDRQKVSLYHEVPNTRLYLIRLDPLNYKLVWSVHHIFLDGWSTALLIKEVFERYEERYDESQVKQEELGQPLAAFHGFLNNQDKEKSKSFFIDYLKELKTATLLGEIGKHKSKIFEVKSFHIEERDQNKLIDLCNKSQVTLNVVFQSIWLLILQKATKNDEVSFFTTFSGRSNVLKNINRQVGMYNNMLPVYTDLKKYKDFKDLLTRVQQILLALQKFEHTSLNEIQDWIEWNEPYGLSNSLLVFENFPFENDLSHSLKVTEVFGEVTTGFPVNILITPTVGIDLKFKFDKNWISKELSTWIFSTFQKVVNRLITNDVSLQTIDQITIDVEIAPVQEYIEWNDRKESLDQTSNLPLKGDLIIPRNLTEHKLLAIWSRLLGKQLRGVNQNFFEIGGTSLLAVRMLSKIQKAFDLNLPPITLIKNNSIRDLAQVIEEATGKELEWSSLVPMRSTGHKTPIHCIHAGGGHVYFFSGLAHHLDDEQPVYSIQPMGLDGVSSYHKNIHDMAVDYIKEIKNVQPEGPYILLGSCFSNPVCLEIDKILRQNDEEVQRIFIIDSGGRELGRRAPRVPKHTPIIKRLLRAVTLSPNDLFAAIKKKYLKRREKVVTQIQIATESDQEKNLRKLTYHLWEIYEDYFWEPTKAPVTLIRSSEFANNPEKDFHLERWGALAGDNLSVEVVEGHHLTLFDEPEVIGLAEKLQECLDQEMKK